MRVGSPILVELKEVLKELLNWLKNETPQNLKTYGKMLRNGHVSEYTQCKLIIHLHMCMSILVSVSHINSMVVL